MIDNAVYSYISQTVNRQKVTNQLLERMLLPLSYDLNEVQSVLRENLLPFHKTRHIIIHGLRFY